VIVVMKPDATGAQIEAMTQQIAELGLTPQVIKGEHQTVVAALGQERDGMVEALEVGGGVEKVLPIMAPYKRASSEVKKGRTVVKALGLEVGGVKVAVIAGPCSVESEEQIVAIAKRLKELGASGLRGGAFKPRTSPYSFQGHKEKGLQMLAAAREASDPIIVQTANFSTIDDAIESAIANYETAFRMQTAIPELMNIRGESEATRRLYGLEATYAPTRAYGAQCLIARRLIERGARFIELTCSNLGHDRWDQHSNLRRGHEDNARAVDQPIAGLLHDLKARGLWESTLVVFAGEFGRTPFAQGADGRDHNQFGFSIWFAGGGVKAGYAFGETDEFGYKAIAGKHEIHDLHATMLHLLGVDHTRLTFRFGGRDMRLTDVHGDLLPILV